MTFWQTSLKVVDTLSGLVYPIGGGVNPNIAPEDSVLDKNFFFSDCLNFSDPVLNLQLLTLFQQLALESDTNITYIRTAVSTFQYVKHATRSQLGAMASPFFCLFEPADITSVTQSLEGKCEVQQPQDSLRESFARLYWSTVWQNAHTTPFACFLMFNIPPDLATRIGRLSAYDFYEFLARVKQFGFKLRYHNARLLELMGESAKIGFDPQCSNDPPKNYTYICQFFSIQQLLINKNLLTTTYSVAKPVLDLNALVAMLQGDNFDPQSYAEAHGVSHGELIRLLKNLKNPRKNSFISKLYSKQIASLAVRWGLSKRKVAFISKLQDHHITTVEKNILTMALNDYKDPAILNYDGFEIPKVRAIQAYRLIADSIFGSIYYLLGGNQILRNMNLEVMIVSQLITQEILQKTLKNTDVSLPYTPNDAFELAKQIRDGHISYNYCSDCGSVYISKIDSENSAPTKCPYCALLVPTKKIKKVVTDRIRQYVTPDHIPY